MAYVTAPAIALLLIVGISLLVSARKTTPLRRAAATGKLAKVRRLLDLGTPVDTRDPARRTALHVAAERAASKSWKDCFASALMSMREQRMGIPR